MSSKHVESSVDWKDQAKNMKIIIIGLPGSGKSVQSENITKKYGLVHISTGDLLREVASSDSPHSDQVRKMLQSGELLPDDLVNTVLQEHLPSKGYILDGYPRKESQVDAIQNVDMVLFLNVSEEVIIDRILKRAERKEDGDKKIIEKRIREFREETEPILKYFKKKGILVEVDSGRSPEVVFEDIESAILKILRE